MPKQSAPAQPAAFPQSTGSHAATRAHAATVGSPWDDESAPALPPEIRESGLESADPPTSRRPQSHSRRALLPRPRGARQEGRRERTSYGRLPQPSRRRLCSTNKDRIRPADLSPGMARPIPDSGSTCLLSRKPPPAHSVSCAPPPEHEPYPSHWWHTFPADPRKTASPTAGRPGETPPPVGTPASPLPASRSREYLRAHRTEHRLGASRQRNPVVLPDRERSRKSARRAWRAIATAIVP